MGMQVGGIRRVEVPGEHPELSYPRNRSERFTDELISADGKIFKYRWVEALTRLGMHRGVGASRLCHSIPVAAGVAY